MFSLEPMREPKPFTSASEARDRQQAAVNIRRLYERLAAFDIDTPKIDIRASDWTFDEHKSYIGAMHSGLPHASELEARALAKDILRK